MPSFFVLDIRPKVGTYVQAQCTLQQCKLIYKLIHSNCNYNPQSNLLGVHEHLWFISINMVTFLMSVYHLWYQMTGNTALSLSTHMRTHTHTLTHNLCSQSGHREHQIPFSIKS